MLALGSFYATWKRRYPHGNLQSTPLEIALGTVEENPFMWIIVILLRPAGASRERIPWQAGVDDGNGFFGQSFAVSLACV